MVETQGPPLQPGMMKQGKTNFYNQATSEGKEKAMEFPQSPK